MKTTKIISHTTNQGVNINLFTLPSMLNWSMVITVDANHITYTSRTIDYLQQTI